MTAALRQPYPGLRPFGHDETDLFFGREGSVNDMLRRLARSRFLAVLGASGSGKSSLVRTGLLDGLELGLLTEAGSWWRIVDLRPGASPLRSLARALCGNGAGADEVEQMRAFLLRGPRSIEIWARDNLQPGENLLLLIDQFEELFRYQHYEGHQEAEAFVALLLESARSRTAPLYVTLTMRSEYLGACALFGGLAEAMNEGQYLTPRLGREQCQLAIEGPAGVCGFAIEPALVARLLNDLSEFAPWDTQGSSGLQSQLDQIIRRADQLPLLQHVLNRLWTGAAGQSGTRTLHLADYIAIGGLRGAIDQHLAEITAELTPAQRSGVRPLFRALTTGTTIADAIRRPTTLAELVDITGVARDDLIAICDAFRANGRNFLTPFPPVPLRDDTIIDISHESLIRQWSDLTLWLGEEASDVAELRRLDEAARRADKGELLTGRDLASRAAWVRDSRPRPAWAARYVPDPSATFAFLDRSIAADPRRRRRFWFSRLAVAALVVVLLAFIGLWRQQTLSNAELQVARTKLETQNQDLMTAQNQLSAQNQALLTAQNQLSAQNKQLLTARNQLSTRNSELLRSQGQLSDARKRLSGLLDDTVTAVQNYIAGPIDRLQRDQSYAQSADLLAALIERTLALDRLPQSLIDRMAWQAAVDSATPYTVDQIGPGTRLDRLDPDRSPAFALWRDRDGAGFLSVVDRRTGRSTDRIAFDTEAIGAARSYELAADGRQALLQGDDGRLFRWAAGDPAARRVLDRRWLIAGSQPAAAERRVAAVAFDPQAGSIGVVYRQFDTRFLTLIPLREAAQAPSWPLYQVAAAIAALQPADTAVAVRADDLALVGLDGGAALFSFIVTLPDSGGSEMGLARFDPAAGTAETLVQLGLLRDVQETTQGHVLHLTLKTTAEACAAGPDLLGAVIEVPFGNSCTVDYDLRSRRLTGPAILLPSYLNSYLPRLVAGLDPDPLAPAGDATFGGDGIPVFDVATAGDTATPDRAILDWWLPNESYFYNRDSPAPVQALLAPDGFAVSQVGEDILFTRSDQLGSRAAGDTLRPDFHHLTHDFASATVVMDGAGTLLLAQADGGWWTQGYDPAPDDWTALPVIPAADCGTGTDNSALQSGSSGERGDGAPDVAAPLVETARMVTGARPLQAASLTAPDFLVRMTDARIGLLSLHARDGALTGQLHCLARSAATEVLDVDGVTGTSALTDDSRQAIFVAAFPAGDRAPPLERRIELPPTETVVTAQFMAGNRLAILTRSDRLMIYALAGEPQLLSSQIAFLPQAGLIRTRGDLVLLARDEGGAPADWSSAVLAKVDAAAGTHRILRAGMLPLALDRIGMYRLAGDDGALELMTADYLLRFRLPATAAMPQLASILRAMSDPVLGEQSDSSSQLLGLAASAIESARQTRTDSPYLGCAATIETELSRWPRVMAASRYELDRIRRDCMAIAPHWPTPAAIADLLAIDPAGADPWPEPASRLLALADGGDGLALDALLRWTRARPQPSLAALAATTLSDRLAAASAIGRSAAIPPGLLAYVTSGRDSADPVAQRLLGAAAEDRVLQGDHPALTEAFFHYGAAEAIYRAAGLGTEASQMRDRRIWLADQLTQDERAVAMTRLQAWVPVPPKTSGPLTFGPLTPGPDRLARDVATLDHLATLLDGGAGLDLWKLDLLALRLAAASDSNRVSLAQDAAALLLSRDSWPAAANSAGGLARVMETTAAALPAPAADLRLQLALATLRLFETDGAPVDFSRAAFPDDLSQVYIRALTQALAAGPDRLATTGAGFRFGTRAFSFGSVRYGYSAASIAAETALWLRLQLAQALPDRPDTRTAAAVTRYWLAVNITDTIPERDLNRSGDEEALQALYEDSLQQAFTDLTALERAGPPLSHDDLAVLASATSWAANVLPDAVIREQAPDFALALRALDRLDGEIEQGQPPPPWDRHLSAHLDALDVAASALSAYAGDEPPFGTATPATDRLMMQALGYGARWEQLMQRGATTILDDDDLTGLAIPGIGYAVAYMAVRERNTALPGGPVEATGCDIATAAAFDPDRRAPSRDYDAVADNPVAVSTCLAALAQNPQDPASTFLLGRALSAENFANGASLDSPEAIARYAEAAGLGYAAAFHNLAYKEPDDQQTLLQSYVGRVLLRAFAEAHQGFLALPAADRDDGALDWFLRRAADLGSPQANQILADRVADPADRKFRLLVAAQLWHDQPDFTAETTARNRAAQIVLPADGDLLVNARLAAWKPEPLAGLPPDLAPDPATTGQ